ncbi:oxygen-independent coproporphyrinogen III oxidase [Candidatus Uabimicrobium amorphum]|uniref:Coproporphyrinogen-III oxidase n=1 Tax=Uabimicrobium amorphum TaxID=2596890 RepID=A0A5S9INL7_UABAM|nr:oxygen-independent coproporphyrinogen III oxidase [Candidatus Uabimicrobium amorphum]BBM84360.1 oxygen-independent coproporphyrinogen IIIoxidase [Candidatus Uabimicrobium amorphum]
MHTSSFNFDLLTKYSTPCPRYTSYPTVPHFTSNFSVNSFREEAKSSNEDVSLYIHIPFCKKLCYYCACNMIVTHSEKYMQEYLQWLFREMDMISELIDDKRQVVQIHLGGGSPSYLPCEQLQSLFSHINSRFNIATDCEISIEVDPRNLTPDHLPVMAKLGCNRLSMGVQDLNAQVQQAINRVYDYEMIAETFTTARNLGFHSINVDLMYGLPYQTPQTFAETVEKIVALNPDRMAIFHYAHVPWMKKHQKLIKEDTLPTMAEKWEMFSQTTQRLQKAGYVHIGLDHFAKETDSLAQSLQAGELHRNFQGYTTNGNVEIYAMGITAISQLNNVYVQNVKTIKEYKTNLSQGKLPIFIGRQMTDDDHLRRDVIMEIMCNNYLEKAYIEKRYGIVFNDYFSKALEELVEMEEDGLVILKEDSIKVTEIGRLFIRNIAQKFDYYFIAHSKNTYSKSM